MNINRVILDGLIFSILFGAMVTLIEIINPRYELHNYPPAIRKSVAPKTLEEQKKFKVLATPITMLLTLYLIGVVVITYSNQEIRYFNLFLHYFLIFIILDIFDLVILDWLIFCTLTPQFLIIPGSEGHSSYKDYRFHIYGAGKGVIFAIIFALFFAGITFLVLQTLKV